MTGRQRSKPTPYHDLSWWHSSQAKNCTYSILSQSNRLLWCQSITSNQHYGYICICRSLLMQQWNWKFQLKEPYVNKHFSNNAKMIVSVIVGPAIILEMLFYILLQVQLCHTYHSDKLFQSQGDGLPTNIHCHSLPFVFLQLSVPPQRSKQGQKISFNSQSILQTLNEGTYINYTYIHMVSTILFV